jgi:hypothetical protein
MTPQANPAQKLDADTRDLVRRLFAVVTLRLADAHDLAVEGQSDRKSEERYRALGMLLKGEAEALAALASAISVVLSDRTVVGNRTAKRRPIRAKD